MSSVINTEILNQLREMLGEDFKLILESFHQEGAGIIASMESACVSGDLVKMKEAAHSMKSMSGNVGAMTLSEIADRLQVASVNSDRNQVDELWPKLKSQYVLVVEELGQH